MRRGRPLLNLLVPVLPQLLHLSFNSLLSSPSFCFISYCTPFPFAFPMYFSDRFHILFFLYLFFIPSCVIKGICLIPSNFHAENKNAKTFWPCGLILLAYQNSLFSDTDYKNILCRQCSCLAAEFLKTKELWFYLEHQNLVKSSLN